MINTVNVIEFFEGRISSLRSYSPDKKNEAFEDFRSLAIEHDNSLAEMSKDDFFKEFNGEYSDDNGYSCIIVASVWSLPRRQYGVYLERDDVVMLLRDFFKTRTSHNFYTRDAIELDHLLDLLVELENGEVTSHPISNDPRNPLVYIDISVLSWESIVAILTKKIADILRVLDHQEAFNKNVSHAKNILMVFVKERS